MDEDLIRTLRRWRDADEAGDDDEADAACRTLFATGLTERPIALDFPARAMEAIDAARVADDRRARRSRRAMLAGGLLGGSAAAYYGSGWAIALASSLVVGFLDLFIGATVRLATGVHSGADAWGVVSGLGRAFAAFISDPTVTIAMLAMQIVAVAALIALQRLLGTQTESFK
jgi:hypothetical protein